MAPRRCRFAIRPFPAISLTPSTTASEVPGDARERRHGPIESGDHYNWTKITATPTSTELTRYETALGGGTASGPFTYSPACTVPGTTLLFGQFNESSFSASVTRSDASAWIDAQPQSTPFFAYVAFNAPHFPYQLPPFSLLSQTTVTALQNAGNCGGPYTAGMEAADPLNPSPCDAMRKHLFYNVMLEAVDTEIGRLLNGMSATKKANTMVFILGDNGTPLAAVETLIHTGPNHCKGTSYELGVRVNPQARVWGAPLIASHVGADVAADLVAIGQISRERVAAIRWRTCERVRFRRISIVEPGSRTEIFCQSFGLPGPCQPTERPYDPHGLRPMHVCGTQVLHADVRRKTRALHHPGRHGHGRVQRAIQVDRHAGLPVH